MPLNQGHQLLVAHLAVYLSSQAALALSRVDFFGAADDDLALIAALEASQADVRQGRLGSLPGIVKDVWVYSHPKKIDMRIFTIGHGVTVVSRMTLKHG